MELIIRLRSVELLVFALSVMLIVHAVANRDETLYLFAVAAGSGGITAFLFTEAFGRISKTRPTLFRWGARVFLLPGLLVFGTALLFIGRWGFSHVGL